MVEAFAARQSTLLIAPTGGGKTLSGFLPSLIDIHETRAQGIHTLYVSPLKALTNDIERNLMRPIAEMGLAATVESRTGDTPQAQARPPAPRAAQRVPHHAGKPDADAVGVRCAAAVRGLARGDRGRGAQLRRQQARGFHGAGTFAGLARSPRKPCAPGFPPRSPIRQHSPPGLGQRARPRACCNPACRPSPISACSRPMTRASPMAASWRATPCLRSMRRSARPAPPSCS